MAPAIDTGEVTIRQTVALRRVSVGRFDVISDGIRLAEIRTVRRGRRPGWVVRYHSGPRSVPHMAHRVFRSRAAALASVGAA